MANAMMSAHIRGEETAAIDCTTGWLKDLVNTATLAELQQFAKRVCLNGHHDDFDDVFEGVVVPFTDDEAEDFRQGHMTAVYRHVFNRIVVLEDEARFAAENEALLENEGEDEAEFIQPASVPGQRWR